MIAALLVLSCATELAAPIVAEDATTEPLPTPRLARRLSLDLRGVLPSEAELDAVEADPAALDDLRTEWLADPRLEDRVVAMLAEQWHTRVDVFDIEWRDYDLDESEEFAFERSVGEEPLRLAARVVVEDRPWSDVVTSQTTVANEMLAELWPLEREPGDGWQPATYTDGRPMSGVLSTNGLWWRYNTNRSNMNRRRAAVIVDLLLCEDLLGRPVSFSAGDTLADADGTEDAVHTEPSCLSCHAAIDPIAATLFGFWWVSQYSVEEETYYHAERELLGPAWLEVEPAWFGAPLGGLADLGPHVAADARFSRCAVETFAEGLWRRPPTLEDRATIEALNDDFEADDLRVPGLLDALTRTESYVAAAAWEREDERPVRMLSPDQLGTALADLTGFRWEAEGYDQLANDDIGVRVLLGGVDGHSVYRPQAEPGLSWALTLKRLAEAAATTAVDRDLVDGEGLLLDAVDLEHTPDDLVFSEQIAALHWRLLAERADEATLDGLTGLWLDVHEDHGAREAWIAVLSALLRDPLFVAR